MGFYDNIAATATRIIAQYGAEVTVKRTTGAGAFTTRTAKAVFIEKVEKGGSNFGDAGVQIGDWKLLVEHGAQLLESEIVEHGGRKYSVVYVEPIQPGGSSVADYAWVRIA